MRAFYKTDGISLLTHPDGRQERITWTGMNGETDNKCYHVRRYSDGRIVYAVNCVQVNELPNTSIVRELIAKFTA